MSGPAARVVGVQAGPIRDERFDGRAMATAIRKDARSGPVSVGPLGLDGDAQADTRHHGGPSRALCCYVREHQEAWGREWHREIAPGAFGENLTLTGVDETTVHIGDRFRFGTALIEVASARGPCATLAARLGVPDLVQLVRARGWTGWYCRVLEPGVGEVGSPLQRVLAHPAGVSVAEAYRIKRNKGAPPSDLRRLLGVEALCPHWKRSLQARL